MTVPRHILTIFIRSITIFETGDRKVPAAQNSVNGLLIYPTPGQPEAFATTGLVAGIEDDKHVRFNPPILFLKEPVQGPTDLHVVVTDRDDRNGLVTFLRRVAGSVAGAAGVQFSSDMPGLLRAAFKEAAASGQLAIGGAKEDKLEVVAVATLALRDAERVRGNVTLDILAPRELQRAGKPVIKRNAPNGTIDLEIHWDED